MSKKIPIEMFNRDLQENEAQISRREAFADIFEKDAVGVKDGVLDMGLFRRFFSDRTNELGAGIVSKYDFPIWDTIGKVLSFDMSYFFSYVDRVESCTSVTSEDIYTETDSLDEEQDQREIHEALKGYLVAAGALARQIGSSTYDGWRQLLVEREFLRTHEARFFASEDEFAKFMSRYTELSHLLWADNEIWRRISVAQPPPPPLQKGPKKRGVMGGTMCNR